MLAGLALGLAAIVGIVTIVGFADDGGSGRSVATEQGSPSGLRGNAPPARLMASDFALRDALDGRLVRMSEQRGRVVVLTFLETRCTTACPLIASQLAAALRTLPTADREDVVALAVSSNARDDTDASVRTFLARHHAAGQIRYLNGPVSELRRVWTEYQVLSATESGDADTHSAPVRIYGRSGQWLATQHAGADLSVDNLVTDISVALAR